MEISTKLTLYDFLTMFVCGMLIVFLIWGNHIFPCQGCSCVFKGCDLQTGMWFLISIAAYIIGMVYHSVIEFLSGVLCKIHGKSCCKFNDCKAKTRHVRCLERAKHFWKAFHRNCPTEIGKAKDRMSNLKIAPYSHSEQQNVRDYYNHYYHLMEKGCLGNIPILEAQVAFLKDIIPLLFISLIMSICHCPKINFPVSLFASPCCLCIIISILIISSIYLVVVKQRKIYELVWEGGHFVK